MAPDLRYGGSRSKKDEYNTRTQDGRKPKTAQCSAVAKRFTNRGKYEAFLVMANVTAVATNGQYSKNHHVYFLFLLGLSILSSNVSKFAEMAKNRQQQ